MDVSETFRYAFVEQYAIGGLYGDLWGAMGECAYMVNGAGADICVLEPGVGVCNGISIWQDGRICNRVSIGERWP